MFLSALREAFSWRNAWAEKNSSKATAPGQVGVVRCPLQGLHLVRLLFSCYVVRVLVRGHCVWCDPGSAGSVSTSRPCAWNQPVNSNLGLRPQLRCPFPTVSASSRPRPHHHRISCSRSTGSARPEAQPERGCAPPVVQAQLVNTQARTVEAAPPAAPPLQAPAAMESDDDDIQLVQQVPGAPAAAAPCTSSAAIAE